MITYTILFLTVAFSLFAMDNYDLKQKYIFHPYSIKHKNQHYRFLSHAFLHSDYLHLAFNMYTLWAFGPMVEQRIFPMIMGSDYQANTQLGSMCYILLYTGAIYASSISDYLKNRNNDSYTSLGASGAINAIIFSFILCAPKAEVIFFIPAWVFGILYLAYSFFKSRQKQNEQSFDNIGHDAHFWGAIFGFVFTGALKPQLFISFFNQITHW
jgi:membrane associated rhomboid family serine protease